MWAVLVVVWMLFGCAVESTSERVGAESGGAVATGGEPAATGGSIAETGGVLVSSGGSVASGGETETGGVPAAGGMGGTGGSPVETGGAPSTGGLDSGTGGTGGSPYGYLTGSQTIMGVVESPHTMMSGGERSLSWYTGSSTCKFPKQVIPNGFTGTLVVDVPADCQGIVKFSDTGDIWQSDSFYGPTVNTDPNGQPFSGSIAVLTVRKCEWHNNPSEYAYDYTWETYYQP